MSEIFKPNKKRIAAVVIAVILLIYSIATIIPFYFLGVRSFVPTNKSAVFHLLPPKLDGFNMDSTYGNLATFYNIDLKKAKKTLGIKGYINPNATWREIAEKQNISSEKMIKYFNPYVKYNGWITILTDNRILKSLIMTIVITLSSLIVGGLLAIATGSVLAGFKKRWHSWIYSLYMLQMIITPVMIIIPVYMILGRFFGLSNSYWALFLLFIKGGAIPVMVFTSYISGIPGTLKESVEIDGGNRLQYFIHILLPLMKVPFATFSAIMFPIIWNDLLQGLVFMNADKYTLVPMINSLQGTFTTNYQAIYAGLGLSIIPVLVIYMMFQNLFVKSALSGAIKG
ncbi:MAG: carbohydrate ABC transporter permease [Spirochaetaceae bacterium]|nr:carbohydrate ABC transporter permease [Spirochaetaceae bacterium]